MLRRKIFEKLRVLIAISVLFQQLLKHFCLDFFAPNFDFFTNYEAFYSHIFDICVLKP